MPDLAPGPLERGLLALARACAGRSGTCLLVMVVVLLGFAAAIPRLELRTDGAALHPPGDRAVLLTENDRRAFHDPDEILVLAAPREGHPSFATAEGLRSLARLHAEVASVEGVDGPAVRSAASVVDVAASGMGSLGTFLAHVPDDPDEVRALVERLAQRPSTQGLLLSRSATAAALYVPLSESADRERVAASLERLVARGDGELSMRLLGPTLAETILGQRILADLARLVPIMVAVMAALLLACLRTPGGMLVAMSNMLATLVITVGTMALARIPVTLVTTILPVLLLATCVTDEVHVLARVQARLAAASPRPASAAPAMIDAFAELVRPVVNMTVTTAIGFLSFLGVAIAPLRDLGVLASFGLVVALVLTFSLTPALTARMPVSWFVPPAARRAGRSALRVDLALARRRGAVLLAGCVVLAALLPGLRRLEVQDSWIRNFDQDSALVSAEREFNAAFWGSYRCDVVLEAPAGFFDEPAGLRLVARAASAAAAGPGVGGVVTHLDALDNVAHVLGLRGRAVDQPADALPAVLAVARDIGWPGLERLASPSGDAVRLLVLVNSPDYARSRALLADLATRIEPLAQEAGARFHLSGDIPVATATVSAIVTGQLRSIGWTLAGIGVLLLVANRSLRMTIVQVLPSLAAALALMALMGFAGMALGIATSMFAALTVGVGVDLALHLGHAFERARAEGLPPGEAIEQAVAMTGPGQWWSTVVLALGFLVLSLSAFAPNRELGIVLSGAMLAAYVTTYVFMPRMLTR